MSPSRWPAPAERCSVRAELRGDPMLGTAFPAARLLLVEQPLAWGFGGLRESGFDNETALALEARGREQGVRVQAIRRSGRSPDGLRRRWMLVDTRRASRSVRTGFYDADAELLELPFDGAPGEPATDPLYLVCTHGRHDPCCARLGRPVMGALAELRPEAVWQASHLGGCRFSPTLLVLPLGLMYGRVPASSAERVVSATEAGEVCGEVLRGRIGVSPSAQAAIGLAHAELDLPRADDVAVVSAAALDKASVAVRLETPRGVFDVVVDRTRVDAGGLTCGSPGPSAYIAHAPRSLEPAAL